MITSKIFLKPRRCRDWLHTLSRSRCSKYSNWLENWNTISTWIMLHLWCPIKKRFALGLTMQNISPSTGVERYLSVVANDCPGRQYTSQAVPVFSHRQVWYQRWREWFVISPLGYAQHCSWGTQLYRKQAALVSYTSTEFSETLVKTAIQLGLQCPIKTPDQESCSGPHIASSIFM